MNFIAVDFETANFKRQSICAVGLAVVEDAKVVKTIHKLIKPSPDYYESINSSIHRITAEDTKNAPTFKELWSDLKPYFEKQNIVAHNAAFDFSALRYALDAYQIDYPELDYYCTMLLSKKALPGLINYQLPTLCKHLEINDLNHHNAESDALACAKLMIELFKKHNTQSFKELEKQLKFNKGKIYPNDYLPFSCCIKKKDPQTLFKEPKTGYEPDTEHPFYNKRVAFTGALSNLSREDAQRIVTDIGGITKPINVSRKTNYLVVGCLEYTKFGEGFKSSKLKLAEELIAEGHDLEIISEVDFFKMIHFDTASFEITISQIEADSKEIRNKARNKSDLKAVKLLSETTFHEYISRRQQHNNGEIQMAIHPWEIKQKN
jgi:DNA polymerase-3 subunit epsilon